MKILDSNANFLSIEEKYSQLENSDIAIVSAPYEHTVSYGKGTSKGPEVILAASAFVEFYDDEFDTELCFDKGIATLAPIDFKGRNGKDALDLIKQQVDELLHRGKFVATLGGEHTISTAPIESHFSKYPDMSLLHFDAHSDLRDTYDGSPFSHACFMSRVIEFFPAGSVTQVGIRALCKEEAERINNLHINTFFASEIRRGIYSKNSIDSTNRIDSANWIDAIVNCLNKDVYITFDLDYFDPAIMPSTGTPEPDGFLYSETLDIFRAIRTAGKNIVGFDIVELAPINNLSHPDILAARLLYKMLNIAFAETALP